MNGSREPAWCFPGATGTTGTGRGRGRPEAEAVARGAGTASGRRGAAVASRRRGQGSSGVGRRWCRGGAVRKTATTWGGTRQRGRRRWARATGQRAAGQRENEELNENFTSVFLYTETIGPGSWNQP